MNPAKHIKKEYLLDQMSRLTSSRFGLIDRTLFRRNLALELPTALSYCGKNVGSAADLDSLTAMMRAIAESLERYALNAKERNVLYKKTYKELKALGYQYFYPEYPFFEDFVYKKFPFCKTITPEIKTDWTAVKRLSDNQLIYLPASLIYYNNHKTLTNVLKHPSSNGMSCSFYPSVVEGSLLELIERDTLLYMWLAKSPGEEIILDKISNPPLRELIQRLECKIKQITMLYKYTDTRIPCVYVFLRGKKKYSEPAFLISAAADTDIERACYRSLLEFVQAYNFFYQPFVFEKIIKRMKSQADPKMTSFIDHAVFYTLYENFSKCEFLFHTAGEKKLSELAEKWPPAPQEKMKLLKNCLKDKRVFIADVTPVELVKSPICVTRAYSPDLMDLNYRDDQAFSSSFRKKRVDTIDKFFKKRTERLNTDPHCFP